MADEIHIRPIQEADLPKYRALRLQGLRDHPEAFGADFNEQSNDAEWFAKRIKDSLDGKVSRLFVAEAGEDLIGVAGAFRDVGVKVMHQATVWGVYISPEWRGRGLAGRLVNETLAWCAASGVRVARLSVATTNISAMRCYKKCGFVGWGISPEDIRVGDVYYDELKMWRRV